MNFRAALLSSREHCDYIRNTIKDLELPYELAYEPYEHTKDLPGLFDSIKDQYDAFCTTGAVPQQIIRRLYPDFSKPLECISESVSEFYRILLNLLYKNRDCDFSRVFFDNALHSGNGQPLTALDYLDGSVEFQNLTQDAWMDTVDLSKLLDAEVFIVEKIQSLQREGRLDLVVCRHSHAYQSLKAAGIPCVFAYPAAGNIINALRHLADELSLIRMGENLPGVICISSSSMASLSPEDVTPESTALQLCLLDFDQENTAGLLIKKAASGFELYTTRRTIQRITRQFTQCTLKKYLFGRLGQLADIGYGAGQDIMSARSHAIEALEMAKKDGKSYFIGEDGTRAVPLDLDKDLDKNASEAHLQAISKKTGLSPVTLQRILSALELLGRDEISVLDLANSLQVTAANAGRFINQLQAAGFATVIGEKKALVRGRPTRIYRISF